MFTKAIVRKPCKAMQAGITSANLGEVDYEKAVLQHSLYVEALKQCGLDVKVLEADENFPDSVFVEDTAVLTPNCAIITYPGAESRNAETIEMTNILKYYYPNIEHITGKAILDGGDIMMVGSHFYIGISSRTNEEGAKQFNEIVRRYGMTASTVNMENMLHLKTGISYLENNIIVATDELINNEEFKKFRIINIDKDESYAANCIWVNNIVIIPKSYPKARHAIEKALYKTIELDVSEFRKLDGGLSCLSLRF